DHGLYAVGAARRLRAPYRRRLWATLPAMVGRAGHRFFRAAQRYLQNSSTRIQREFILAYANIGPCRAPSNAGSAAQPWAADALRDRGIAIARPANSVSRRADDRAGRGQQAGGAAVHQDDQPGAGRD